MDTYDIFQAAVALRCARLQATATLATTLGQRTAEEASEGRATMWSAVVADAIAGLQEAQRQMPGPKSRTPGADPNINPTAFRAAGAV